MQYKLPTKKDRVTTKNKSLLPAQESYHKNIKNVQQTRIVELRSRHTTKEQT